MTSATKDCEGTWLSPPRICDKRWSAWGIIFLERVGWAEREEDRWFWQARAERSRVGFEVLAGGEADLVKLLSLSSSETNGLLLFCTPEVPPFPAIQIWNRQKVGYRSNYQLKLKTVDERGGVGRCLLNWKDVWKGKELTGTWSALCASAPRWLWRLQFYVKTGGE